MTYLVDPEYIEEIVGHHRRYAEHLAKAVSSEQNVYILHSTICIGSDLDLRDCKYSLALDNGIDLEEWRGFLDRTVILDVVNNRLYPVELDGE